MSQDEQEASNYLDSGKGRWKHHRQIWYKSEGTTTTTTLTYVVNSCGTLAYKLATM